MVIGIYLLIGLAIFLFMANGLYKGILEDDEIQRVGFNNSINMGIAMIILVLFWPYFLFYWIKKRIKKLTNKNDNEN